MLLFQLDIQLNNCRNLIFLYLEFQNTVLRNLASLQATSEQILLTMQEVLRYNKKSAVEKLIAPENVPVSLKIIRRIYEF